MLVISRKASDLLKKKNEPEMFSTFRIVVPPDAINRVVTVQLLAVKASGTASIGVVADRDVIVSRSELIKE